MLPENMTVKTVHEGRNFHRYLYLGDEEISALAVTDFTVRLGTSLVRTGGIGYVRTPEQHQRKGYMKILMNNTIEWMIEEGFDTSTLLGIPHFYHKFGFAVSLPQIKYTLDYEFIHDVKVNREGLTIRPVEIDDFENVLALYNQNNADQTGSFLRTRDFFWGFARGAELYSQADHFLIENEQKELLAYVVFDRNEKVLNICEIETVDTSLYYVIMDELKRLDETPERDLADMHFFLPDHHPFARFIRRYGCTVSTEYPQNGMGMTRICNLQPLMEKLRLEIQQRVQNNLGEEYCGELQIITDLGAVTLVVKHGILSLENRDSDAKFFVPQQNLSQLLHGYRELDDLLIDPTDSIKSDNPQLAEQLAPEKSPYLWSTDLF